MEQLILLVTDDQDPCDDWINCPRVFKLGENAVVQGYKVSPEIRAQLNLPDGEDAVMLPGRMIVAAGHHELLGDKQ